jgi:hypothetical protein
MMNDKKQTKGNMNQNDDYEDDPLNPAKGFIFAAAIVSFMIIVIYSLVKLVQYLIS